MPPSVQVPHPETDSYSTHRANSTPSITCFIYIDMGVRMDRGRCRVDALRRSLAAPSDCPSPSPPRTLLRFALKKALALISGSRPETIAPGPELQPHGGASCQRRAFNWHGRRLGVCHSTLRRPDVDDTYPPPKFICAKLACTTSLREVWYMPAYSSYADDSAVA